MIQNFILEGKTALVTGAGRGIGKAIAKKLALYGAFVIVNYNGSREKAEEAVLEIKNQGGNAIAIGCDVADFEASKAMVEQLISTYGKIDILVNNAGITRDNLIARMTEQEFDEVISTNLKGAFNLTRHLSKYLIKNRGGRIINISSVSGVSGNAGQANYSASKAGLIGLTKSLAKELAARNICVNAIAPGFIETDMTKKMDERVAENIVNAIPLKRMGNTEDIANAALFLASDLSGYITGQILCVDGGMTI